ncbi:hypothetical protein JCM10207_006611 [Rhodosporidiobolus poonsookiae]
MTDRATVLKQIDDATVGFEALLDSDLDKAKAILVADERSSFHLVGLGIAAFLAATLSREDTELKQATEILGRAEGLAKTEAGAKRSREAPQVYPPGTEFKLLHGDAVIGQALVAILSESYMEFVKAIFKLNSAYKLFTSLYSTVFPDGVQEDESLDAIFTKLNTFYLKQSTSSSLAPPEPSGGGGFFSSWGKKKGAALASNLRHASSSSALASSAAPSTSAVSVSASAPGSELPSADASVDDLAKGLSSRLSLGDEGSYPAPAWKDDPLVTLIISGAALGSGMFGLIFSLLPPKMRKAISWFGFSNSNRSVALKLLTVSSSTGNDVHGYFASLVLLTYYGFVLLMSGWQADQDHLLNQVSAILDRVTNKFPNGTLFILNRAKYLRYKRDVESAISVLEAGLAKGTSFREADSLLVFELSWLYLSQARFLDTATSFERMNEMNSWSPPTYQALTSGALVDHYNTLPPDDRTPDLAARITASFDKLPPLFSMKRVFGEKPVTETFIARRLEVHKAKLARWIAAGKVKPDAKVWEVIRISNAFELGLFWATVGNRSPISGVEKQIALLSSFSPAPRFSPSTSTPPAFPALSPSLTRSSTFSRQRNIPTPNAAARQFTADDLDSPDEVALRDLLLGVLYTSLGDAASLECAQQYYTAVLDASSAGLIVEELWVAPFARFHLAIALAKGGDLQERKMREEGKASASELQAAWKKVLAPAEQLLEAIFSSGEFDLKSRLEQRTQMLQSEIATKKKKLGL